MQKLWEKDVPLHAAIEKFTIGHDNILDLQLAPHDVLGSLAHAAMLQHIGLLTETELQSLQTALKAIYKEIAQGQFLIEPGIEDVHSQIELLLTRRIGEAGKKIHSGRSRNDQVLLDLKLFTRAQLQTLAEGTHALFETLQSLSEQYRDVLLPGYTHLQIAMPSSFGLWFGAYAEALCDDLLLLQTAYRISDKNPLGSGAGYGSSFPLDRQLVTDLLGFEQMAYNVVYAQMGRGKTELVVAQALAALAYTIGKLAGDICLYNAQNFGFVKLPDAFTTGSSIMPHKKNPDVFELIRAKCNRIKALPNEVLLLTANMPSGYHRDWQILKESYLPAFGLLADCLALCTLALPEMQINRNILQDDRYALLFTVERANELSLQGLPFREAYKQVGREVESGSFHYDKALQHTHAGSIGDLCTTTIKAQFENTRQGFNFARAQQAIANLLA